MSINQFQDGWTLKTIRENHLNKVIEQSNANLAKVTGLQDIVYRSFVRATVDGTNNTIVFVKYDGDPAQTLDLSPMFDNYQHGMDIGKEGSPKYMQQHSMVFSGAVDVGVSGADVKVTIPGMTGNISGADKAIKGITLLGNVGTSYIDTKGVMFIDLGGSGGGSISGQIDGGGTLPIDTINIKGHKGSSVITGRTLHVDLPIPEALEGRLSTADAYVSLKTLTLEGNRGNSSISVDGNMVLDLPEITGQVSDTGNIEDVRRIKVTGAVGSSELKSHVLNIDIPDQGLSVKEGAAGMPTTQVREITFEHAKVAINPPDGSNKTKITVTPTGMKGKVKAGAPEQDIKTLTVTGHVDGTTIDPDGLMTINVPKITGNVDGVADQEIKGIKISGNRGGSTIDKGIMEIVLPAGGGTGGSITGQVDGSAQAPITKVFVKGNKGTSSVSGDVLTIDLPAGGGGGGGDLIVTDGTTPVTAVEVLEFNNAIVTENSTSGKHTAVVHLKGVDIDAKGDGTLEPLKQLKFEGWTKDNVVSKDGEAVIQIPNLRTPLGGPTGEHHIDSIEVIGNLGATSYHDGTLTIDLPAGGGGGPGGALTGIVGSDNATISSLQITGNLEGTTVSKDTSRMTVNIPDKVSFYDGATTIDKVEMVQVAHSSMKATTHAGKKLVTITPELMVFFNGWFPSYSDMDSKIPEATRIPTKTCAYVQEQTATSGLMQNRMYMWMPGSTGAPEWQEVLINSSLPFKDGNDITGRVISIKKNDMVTINNNSGELTILDVSVPKVLVDINDGPGTITQGHFTKLSFTDGPSWVDLDTNKMELTLQRPIRRGDYGFDITGKDPTMAHRDHEGNVVFNKDDKTWWGYDDPNAATDQHKWKPIAYGGMADDVRDLNTRVPDTLTQVTSVDLTGDTKEWAYSGWTGVGKDAPTGVLPPQSQGQTGMVIQTFKGPAPGGGTGRIQIGWLGTTAAMYKRFRDDTTNRWSDWVKMSFNPGDLSEHNKDIQAHRIAHPYYKALTFDCTYKQLKDSGQWLPSQYVHVLGSSDGRHQYNADSLATVAYDGDYRIRGHIYLSRAEVIDAKAYGVWKIHIDKRPKGGNWTEIYTAEYDHNTTTMAYPPLKWDTGNKTLKSGDDIRVGFTFTPKAGTTIDQWLTTYPDIGFYGLRSYVSIDEDGNDGGHALGETHRRVHGHFVGTGNTGLKIFWDAYQNKNRVVDETINRFETEMKP